MLKIRSFFITALLVFVVTACGIDDRGQPSINSVEQTGNGDFDGNCGTASNDQVNSIQHLCGWENGILVWQDPDQYSPTIGSLGATDQPTGNTVCNQGYKWFEVSSSSGYPQAQSSSSTGWVADNGNNACPVGYTGSDPAKFGGGTPPWVSP